MDIRLALMCGSDIPIPECQLTLHQPTIKEISYLGEIDFFTGIQCLCVDKKIITQDKTVLSKINNFQVFMTIMADEQAVGKKQSVIQSLQLFFPKYKIAITPRSIIFMDLNNSSETIYIDENNFEYLQTIIFEVCCLNSKQNGNQQTFNPANKQAQEIAEKLMRGRQRVAQQKGEENSSLFVQYLSILTIGLHSMSLQNLMELTMFQMYDLIERFSLYMAWDIDIRSRLAGGKPDGSPDNWMKNLH